MLARQASASEAVREWALCQGGEMRFHAQSVPFLGYIVSVEGNAHGSGQDQAVVDWPTPDSRKALQRFLVLCQFYRAFIAVSAS